MDLLTGFLYVLCTSVQVLLDVFMYAIFLRAILSWFIFDEDAWYIRLLDLISAPVLFPLRALFDRFGWFDGLPIDLTPMIAMLLLTFLTAFLPSIPL